VDTSVLGGCFDAEFSVWSNRLIRDFQRGAFIPVLSEVVAVEVRPAPEEVQAKYAEVLALTREFLEVSRDALDLIAAYGEHGVLPPRFRNDMLHIALATIADVDVLVSWNFKHIVRLEKIRVFNAVNLELGYKQLQIYSPREVASHEEE
jgi:predicted nucleic acid-binding protein